MQAKLTMMMSPARTIAQLPPIIAPAILKAASVQEVSSAASQQHADPQACKTLLLG
jgi:hypothetical protein